MYWHLGKAENSEFPVNLKSYEYLGAHASDSGLTAVVEEDPFKDESSTPVDWTEFVLTTLDDAEGTPEEMEEYTLYKFFGKIPDDSSEAAIFGKKSDDGVAYSSIIIRALDAVIPDDQEP